MTDAWTEKFDRWWAEHYGQLDRTDNQFTTRVVRRVASLAFIAGAAAAEGMKREPLPPDDDSYDEELFR